MVAALASLEPDLPVTLTASVGGAYPPWTIAYFGEFAPFDVDDERECQLRSMLPFAGQLAHTHIAYVGEDDEVLRSDFEAVRAAVRRSRGRLRLVEVPGDHLGSLDPAMRHFLERVRSR